MHRIALIVILAGLCSLSGTFAPIPSQGEPGVEAVLGAARAEAQAWTPEPATWMTGSRDTQEPLPVAGDGTTVRAGLCDPICDPGCLGYGGYPLSCDRFGCFCICC